MLLRTKGDQLGLELNNPLIMHYLINIPKKIYLLKTIDMPSGKKMHGRNVYKKLLSDILKESIKYLTKPEHHKNIFYMTKSFPHINSQHIIE